MKTPLTCQKEFSGYKGRIYCSQNCFPHSFCTKGKKLPNRSGENHPRYIKDRSQLKKRDRRYFGPDSAYHYWRKQVWTRDNFKCKISDNKCNGRIEAHHILRWSEYPELRYEINNGITLCHAHHPLKRAEEKRLSPYFQELVSASKDQN